MISLIKFFQPVRILLLQLYNPRIAELNETEKVIINPFIREVSGYAEKLSGAIGQLHIHQPIEQNER